MLTTISLLHHARRCDLEASFDSRGLVTLRERHGTGVIYGLTIERATEFLDHLENHQRLTAACRVPRIPAADTQPGRSRAGGGE